MTKYRLKSGPNFEMTDGPLAGRKFERGKTYGEVPANMADRFEIIEPPETKEPKPKRGDKTK